MFGVLCTGVSLGIFALGCESCLCVRIMLIFIMFFIVCICLVSFSFTINKLNKSEMGVVQGDLLHWHVRTNWLVRTNLT